MQRQPLDEHAGVVQLVVYLPVVFQGVEHPGLGRGRVGGVRGDRVVGVGRDLEVVAPIVADQRPVVAGQHVPVLRAEQGHGVAHVGHDVHRLDRDVVRGDRAQRDSAADRVDQHPLRVGLQEQRQVAEDFERGDRVSVGRHLFDAVDQQFLDLADLEDGQRAGHALAVEQQLAPYVLEAVVPFHERQFFRQHDRGSGDRQRRGHAGQSACLALRGDDEQEDEAGPDRYPGQDQQAAAQPEERDQQQPAGQRAGETAEGVGGKHDAGGTLRRSAGSRPKDVDQQRGHEAAYRGRDERDRSRRGQTDQSQPQPMGAADLAAQVQRDRMKVVQQPERHEYGRGPDDLRDCEYERLVGLVRTRRAARRVQPRAQGQPGQDGGQHDREGIGVVGDHADQRADPDDLQRQADEAGQEWKHKQTGSLRPRPRTRGSLGCPCRPGRSRLLRCFGLAPPRARHGEGDAADREIDRAGDQRGLKNAIGADEEDAGEKGAQHRAGGVDGVQQPDLAPDRTVGGHVTRQRGQGQPHQGRRAGQHQQRQQDLQAEAAAGRDVHGLHAAQHGRKRQPQHGDQPFGHAVHRERMITAEAPVLAHQIAEGQPQHERGGRHGHGIRGQPEHDVQQALPHDFIDERCEPGDEEEQQKHGGPRHAYASRRPHQTCGRAMLVRERPSPAGRSARCRTRVRRSDTAARSRPRRPARSAPRRPGTSAAG